MSTNITSIVNSLNNQTNNQLGLYLFCCSITVIWTVYVLFFNSRLVGSIATFLLNIYLKRYSKTVWIKIRSLSISFLSGKIMFCGVHYITLDYSLYIQEGWICFAYWKPQFVKDKKPKEKTKNPNDSNNLNGKQDTLKRNARLIIHLCNFQLHYYNSWKTDNSSSSSASSNSASANNNNRQNQNLNESQNNRLFNSTLFVKNLTSNTIVNFLSGCYSNNSNNLENSSHFPINSNPNPNNTSKSNLINNQSSDYNFTEDLMQLFSVVSIRIIKGKVFAGNSTLPSTLTFKISNSKMELVTEKSQSKVDEYCFILRGELNKLEINLIPNKKIQFLQNENYQMNTEKKYENRVLIFKCISSDFEYVQDVPSILTFDRRYLQKNETGELIQNEKEPQWSLLLNCNKHTIINYGPWFDRQREALWKFFFPPTYEILEPQPEPTLNERRQISKFDFLINLKDPSTELNLIFNSSCSNTTNDPANIPTVEPNDLNEFLKAYATTERKITFKCRTNSFLKISIPWLTKQYGYKTNIYGEFNRVQSSTSLSFKEFLISEKLKLDIDINYPLVWNDLQTWNINIELFKGSTYFVFYHKNFFQDLINDWSSKVMSDIRHFVPYIYKIRLKANEIEVILPCNQHNWIDTSVLENNSFFAVLANEALVGLDISFEEFQPEKTNIILDVKIFDACARFIVPPTNNHLSLLKILKKNLKYIPFEGNEKYTFDSNKWSQFNQEYLDSNQAQYANNNKNSNSKDSTKTNKKSLSQTNKQNKTSKTDVKNDNSTKQNHVRFNNTVNQNNRLHENHFQENWIECWQAKNASVVLNFEYHPCPLLDWNNKNLPSVEYLKSLNSPHFDCEIFEPDTIYLDIELGPSVVMLYGTFLKRLWYIKEAYFSWDQLYTEIAKNLEQLISDPSDTSKTQFKSKVSKPYYDIPVNLITCNHKDPRNFRPLSVKLSLAIHNINGHLVLDPTEGVGNVAFPIGFTKMIALELDKKYSETKLQLFIEPLNIFVEDLLPRKFDKNLYQGHLCLSSVQVRGHAMFSDEKRLKTDTLEYAWLLEILLGDITGAVSPIQAEQVIHGVETLLTLLLENEYQLEPVFANRVDPGLPYKYEVTRFSLDLIDLFLVESGTALNFNLHPVRLSLCNSHTKDYAKGLSAGIGEFNLKMFINEASRLENENEHKNNISNFKKPYCKTRTSSNSRIDSISNISHLSSSSSNSSLSSISISTLNSSSVYSKLDKNSVSSQNTLVLNSDLNLKKKLTKQNISKSNFSLNGDLTNLIQNKTQKIPDSNEFNYWFEVSSLSSGTISIDLALDKGNPEEQLEFLRLHDLKTKRLYFLWDSFEISSKKLCGCVGACSFYSCFDFSNRLNELDNKENFEFFNLKKSITRSNQDFGRSLFYPDKHILKSQPIMTRLYNLESYTYNEKLLNDTEKENCMMNQTSAKLNQTVMQIKKNQSALSLDKNPNLKHKSLSSINNKSRLSASLSTLSNNKRLESKSSLASRSDVLNPNEDDYYTADEEDDENLDELSIKIKNKILSGSKKKLPRVSMKSLNSSRSKQSYFSVKEINNFNNQAQTEQESNLNDKNKEPENLNQTLIMNETIENLKIDLNESVDFNLNKTNNLSNLFDTEPRMDLNFDIKRPILDSSLPKYCYLKYLSRAYVQNWNQTCLYPYYEDFSNKNIFFAYRKKGIDFKNVISTTYSTRSSSLDETKINFESTHSNLNTDSIIKCRINLKFSTFETYLTPLSLTGLGRFTEALKMYRINPNSLITELQTKAHAHTASNSFKEAISKTQVSLKIPQIRLFSLQCGLAEGDKISNAFVSTLANPDEFITLSLFTICIYSIETQLIDSQTKTAAIFMIDKIDTQFCRLYEPDSLKKISMQDDFNESQDNFSKLIKLSCISDENSKTSIKFFEGNANPSEPGYLKSLIMHECAFDEISIKAIKKINEESETSLNQDQKQTEQKTANGRLSICEFDISKIWFSFPEPPTSPKGKRKIPFSRFDWNLLSSVSPAVISWLCASKDNIKSFKELFVNRNKQTIEILAALLVGSFKNLEHLENIIESKFDYLNKASQLKANENQAQQSSRFRSKINQSNNQHLILRNDMQNFLNAYLTKFSLAVYKDPNCKLVNIIRNYLYFFNDKLYSDLKSPFMPDIKYLKKGINEVLNTWPTITMNSIDKIFSNNMNNHVSNSYDVFNVNSKNPFISSNMTHSRSFDQFRFMTEIRENRKTSQEMMTSLNDKNLVTTQLLNEEAIELNKLKSGSKESLNKQGLTSSDESVENYQINIEKSSADEYEKKALHGHVGPQLKNTSKIFKPILTFIGIDAPSGTLIDNLFKEFGSLLFGNLNIKSVQINILDSLNSKLNLPTENDTNNANKYRTFMRRRSQSSSHDFLKDREITNDKIITTILSFDDLLFNINVRQVLPENLNEKLTKTNSENDTLNKSKVKETAFSMANPVYIATNSSQTENNKLVQNAPKYYTKIDAGIRVNNLTQEVNMPLLRLVHQIYSIIADAIDYDKEQNRLNSSLNYKEDSNLNAHSAQNDAYLIKIPNYTHMNSFNEQQNLNFNKDCWKYMGGILELREFVPEPKYVEKTELDRKNSHKNHQRYVHITKDAFTKEKSHVSFFGWVNIKRINSKAGLGTLALNGEMKNMQMTVLLGRKMIGNSSKLQYEGSLNVCMDSTFGRLTENNEKKNVVLMNIGKSHLFGYLKNLSLNNMFSSFVHIGHINIDVPLRPMIVHGVVYRESKVIEQKILPEIKNFAIFENTDEALKDDKQNQEKAGKYKTDKDIKASASTHQFNEKLTNQDQIDSVQSPTAFERRQQFNQSSSKSRSNQTYSNSPSQQTVIIENELKQQQDKEQSQQQSDQQSDQKLKKSQSTFLNKQKNKHQLSLTNNHNKKSLFNKFIFQFKSKFDGLEIRAKLLENPCLKAAYLIKDVECNAQLTNEKSNISCNLNSHCLSFQCDDELNNFDKNIFNKTIFKNSQKTKFEDISSPFMSMKPLEERTNFFLPSISLAGNHLTKFIHIENQENQSSSQLSNPKTVKSVNLTQIQFKVKISSLTRELNAEVIAQLVFVAKVFIKEINYILQAVYGLDNSGAELATENTPRSTKINANSSCQTNSFHTPTKQQQASNNNNNNSNNNNPNNSSNNNNAFFNYFIYDFKIEMGKISLTGITPTNTALTLFSGDKSILMLTNNNLKINLFDSKQVLDWFKIINDYEFNLKPLIEAKAQLSVELKTFLNSFNNGQQNQKFDLYNNSNIGKTNNDNKIGNSNGNTNTDSSDWYQLAYFNTKFDLKNDIKSSNESIMITVEKPRFYLQPGAVDCAILFWLNYKNTYEFWLQQRQQFSSQIDQDLKFKQTASPITTLNQLNESNKQNINNFLTLKLRVTGLGLALPLSSKMTKNFFSANTDCLVISLNETAIYACSSGCVVSKGQFSNFCLRFIENFNLSTSEWAPPNIIAQDAYKFNQNSSFYHKILMNSWIVPSGNYEVCSSTIDKPKSQINLKENLNLLKSTPIWILSVKWKMEGIEVNLDTNIGKWLTKLADTVTRLAETQTYKENSATDNETEIKRLKKELNYHIEKGDTSKANMVQSRLDLINLASYPEKAKQILVKTRNNLIKGQLGFNSNQLQQQQQKSQQSTTPVKVTNDINAAKNLNFTFINNDPKTAAISSLNHDLPSPKTPSYRRHSVSNDDLNYSANRLGKFVQSPSLVEENENENLDSSANVTNTNSVNINNKIAQPLAPITTTTPSIDFKLNIKIEISSGKCVLHANKNNPSSGSRAKADKTHNNPGSPMSGYFMNTGFSQSYMEPDMRNTNFIFPAIGVKTFYESTHKKIENRLNKKANLYAMIKLESFVMPSNINSFNNMMNRDVYLSRDMIISPALLDFLEQTLEPFDLIKASFESVTTPVQNKMNKNFYNDETKSSYEKSEDDENENSSPDFVYDTIRRKSKTIPQSQVQQVQEPSYFPVDVVVFVSMLPSSIRFTCLPQSTMECLLKLPSLEMVFSTSRMDGETQNKIENMLKSDSNTMNKDDYLISSSLNQSHNEGGLNLTCSLSDFSLKFYNRLARNPFDAKLFYNEHLNFEEKDSLSVRVAYIKVNISRSRRTFNRNEYSDSNKVLNDVRLSILADVGNTSFIYDMRNIKEVFVFPKIWYRRSLTRRLFLGEESSIPVNSNQAELKTHTDVKNKESSIKRPKTLEISASQESNSYTLNPNWKNLVLISVNLIGLEVKMNIGSVMGNVILLTKNGRLTSKISISRFGPKDMEFNFSIDNTKLIAEGGSNGCLLRIQDITTAIHIKDLNQQTKSPLHKIEFGIFAAECRIDSAYNQASPILAFRLSNLNLKLNDSWESNLSQHLNNDSNRLPEALVDLNVTWDQFHLMMTRSTTADLILLYYKLIDFFEKQVMESKDYIKECEFDLFYEMKVKQQFIEKKEANVKKYFNVNGGNIQLKGNNFTLITFHGNSFKAIKWAVFSLNEPAMDFASQNYIKDGTCNIIRQNLIFSMGRNERKKDMASIYMVYRDTTSIFTKFQSIKEWFEYAHSSIDAVGLRDFPRFTSDEHPLLVSQNVKKKVGDQTKWEEIFHLPSLQILCDTTQESNNVKFDFKTEFHDHIQMTFRTELFGFLHELITSYLKETDITRSKEPTIPNLKKDERHYECVRWELEPTLRLISKFGSSVEPLGVDGLLKSLGFTHARTTIPKWLQRGLLDNLDDVMHSLIKVYIKLLSDYNPNIEHLS